MSLKRAFDEDSESMGPMSSTYGSGGKTMRDLYSAILRDPALTYEQKNSLMAEIKRMVGFASEATPLEELMTGRFNDTIRALISKYFSMNQMAQNMVTAMGGGVGSSLFGAIPRKQYLGWRLL